MLATTLPDFYHPRTPPLQHQHEALVDGWRREFFAYFMEMGLGKSRTAIDDFCLNVSDGRLEGLVVVAPKNVYSNWTRQDDDNPGELQKWLWTEYAREARVYEYRAGRGKRDGSERAALLDKTASGVRILAVNVESMATTDDSVNLMVSFMRAYRCMIVVDESTLLKNPKSRRTRILIKIARLAHMRRIMTGSPSTGSQADMWAQFEFLNPGSNPLGFRNWTVFRAHFCQLREIVAAGRTIKIEVGPLNTSELATLVARHSFRRRKIDCLDLPPKQFMPPRMVEMSAEQRQVYDDLKRTAMAHIRADSEQRGEVSTEIVITQLMRMHQVVCGHVKTDDGRILRLENKRMEALEEIVGGTEESVVIWAGYRPDADMIAVRLRELYGPDSVAEWHGGIKMAEREIGEGDFQAGRRRFMVATSAGARGRTWTTATLVVYYSNSYDLEIREQSEDRTHRIGTVGTVTYIDLMCAGTVDEKIVRALRGKRIVARAILNEGWEAWI